jgi:predicted TIM-barrel fold metal-dependent hydrolase
MNMARFGHSTLRPSAVAGMLVAASVTLSACGSDGADSGPSDGARPLPVIDMHLHASLASNNGPPPLAMCTPAPVGAPLDPSQGSMTDLFFSWQKEPPCDDPVWSPETDEGLMRETLEALERLNVFGVTSGPPSLVRLWRAESPERIIPAVLLRLGQGQVPLDTLRAMHERGELAVLGEVTTQYQGIHPADPALAPYWALAEELDIPVGIHVGTGPPGVAYMGAEGYTAALHSALTMEEVLFRHPQLRVYLMHAGYPMLDDTLALLYVHPQVYVDLGVIIFTQPRPALYRFLEGLVDAGFGERILFGSDQMVWPGVIERSIAVINEAPFLTEQQKRDILYNNAARFLRLSDEEIARHHDGRR